MDKLIEALKKMLPAEHVGEVTAAIEKEFDEANTRLEAEFNQKLEEGYAQMSAEMREAEKVAEKGYTEAYGIITDLRTRMGQMQREYEVHNDEVCEEAYEMWMQARAKGDELEKRLYAEYDGKLLEMKEYVVTKLDEFLQQKGKEIYEQARRDILSDPRYAEHKVAFDEIAHIVSRHVDTEEQAFATGSRLEEAVKTIDDLKGQLRMLEARNIRLDSDNRHLQNTTARLTESTQNNKQERARNAQNATGRGRVVTQEQVEVIKEYNSTPAVTKDTETSLVIEHSEDMKVLAGLAKSK
jgi:hypothetical protein